LLRYFSKKVLGTLYEPQETPGFVSRQINQSFVADVVLGQILSASEVYPAEENRLLIWQLQYELLPQVVAYAGFPAQMAGPDHNQ